MVELVSRQGIQIKDQPIDKFEIGGIFQYSGSFPRLKGFVLIHQLNPELRMLSEKEGRKVIDTDHVVAEVLCPNLGYADYCLFWIEKRHLRSPSPEQFAQIRSRLS